MFCTLERSGAKPAIGQLSIVWLGWKVIDEIRLWTDHAQGRCRADPCGSRLADGRAAAPLLAAGGAVRRTRRFAETRAHPRRGPRRVPHEGGQGRLPSICIARIAARRWNSAVSSRAASVAAITAGSTTPRDASSKCRARRRGSASGCRSSSRPIRSHEFGGLVFVYMGPPEKEPAFPLYDVFDADRARCRVARHEDLGRLLGRHRSRTATGCSTTRMSSIPGTSSSCTRPISGEQFRGAMMQGVPRIALREDGARRALQHRSRSAERQPLRPPRRVRAAEHLSRAEPARARHGRPSARTGARKCRGACRSTTSTSPRSASSRGRWRTARPRSDWRPGTDTVLDIRPATINRPL